MVARGLVRVDVHSRAVEQLLKGSEWDRLGSSMAESIRDGAGAGHEVIRDMGPNRLRFEIRTETFEAMRSEARSRTLTRAIDRGRR